MSGTLTQATLNCERDAHACPPKFASVVQSVEQALRKRQAVGSRLWQILEGEIECPAILRGDQGSTSRGDAKVRGQATLN
ncbi:MAG: hypothetical protein CO002_03440 [Candidatus Portnoybacteria bacterium CG_4_8_14_3_um_filter_44_10]|uniref:Uncharacterized protein n=1 Tax=Candidatus Portnoybacteria bacterium CG_4_8_14_3_um_filter_44_10 TaxID=1974802 RepID=A0A2M7IFD6_9BACT|nr:MAG: hypothetical protein CO002_03440 [Candidatus Portnoybacteria bacterium CG_4_8_14_3_um_filter_44_10]